MNLGVAIAVVALVINLVTLVLCWVDHRAMRRLEQERNRPAR